MIKCIDAVLVICDDCGKVVMLETWQSASKLGWAVPNDGAFQLCPACKEKKVQRLIAEAKIAELASKCPLVN